jgi:hypothetical protein
MMNIENSGRFSESGIRYFVYSLPFLLIPVAVLSVVYYWELLLIVGLPWDFHIKFSYMYVSMLWSFDLLVSFLGFKERSILRHTKPTTLGLSYCCAFFLLFAIFAIIAELSR